MKVVREASVKVKIREPTAASVAGLFRVDADRDGVEVEVDVEGDFGPELDAPATIE